MHSRANLTSTIVRSLLLVLAVITSSSGFAANHYIVLFDASGSVRKEHTGAKDFWQGSLGNTERMAEVVRQFVEKSFDEIPVNQSFPKYEPAKDIFSFLLFHIDYYNPSYSQSQLFLSNDRLLAVIGHLPPAEYYEHFDAGARNGSEGEEVELNDVFGGHSPLVAATGASLPFLADSIRKAGLPNGAYAPPVDRTFIIRITDGQYNSDANASDERAVIQRTAEKARTADHEKAAGDDGYASHVALVRKVNSVFDIGTRRVDCALPTNEKGNPFDQPFDCSQESYRKVSKWGLGFLISYIEVTLKTPSLGGLARVETTNLELETEYRYSDSKIHLTGRNPLFAFRSMDPGGLYEIEPIRVQWRSPQTEWQNCSKPDAGTGRVDCHKGDVFDFTLPDEAGGHIYPEWLKYRVDYEMRFPGETGRTLLYPFSRALSEQNVPTVAVVRKENSAATYFKLPREPDDVPRPWWHPARFLNPSDPVFPEKVIDDKALQSLAAAWETDFSDDDAVLPDMIARVSRVKMEEVWKQEKELNTRAENLYTIGPGLILLFGVLAFLFWPYRRLKIQTETLFGDGLLLDLNHREYESIALVGLVRVINTAGILRKASFRKLKLSLVTDVPILKPIVGDTALEPIGDDAVSEQIPLILETDNVTPLSIGAPGDTFVQEVSIVSGKEFLIFFSMAKISDIDRTAEDKETHVISQVQVNVDARKLGAEDVSFEIPLVIRSENSSVAITATGVSNVSGIRQVEKEYVSGDRAEKLCTYHVKNTTKHRYSQMASGEIRVSITNVAGHSMDIVHFLEGDKQVESIAYDLSHADDLEIPVVIDFTRFKNPVAEVQYRVSIDRREGVARGLDHWRHLDGFLLRVQRSSERTDVSMQVRENDKHQTPALNMDQLEFSGKFRIGEDTPVLVRQQPSQAQNKTTLATLRLLNTCRNGHGYAEWVARITVPNEEGVSFETNPVHLIDARGQEVDHGILRDSHLEDVRCIELQIEIDNRKIHIQRREMSLQLDIDVDWTVYEDGDLDPENVSSFTTKVTLEASMRHDPPRNVLAIDFGTSAMAIAHASGPGAVEPLRLVDRLRTIEAQPGEPRRRQDDPASSNHFFLASECNVCTDADKLKELRPEDAEFLDLPLTLPAMYGYPEMCFSSLKAMISAGITSLPLDPSKHPYLNQEGNAETNRHPPLDQVICGAYRGLLKNFIEPLLGASNQGFSRLYITHPNTYTQNHVRELQNIVEKVFNGMRRGDDIVYADNIHFFSESDAVAYYYLVNAHRFRGGASEFPGLERVLVYDIGAGTLDLTHLEIEWRENLTGGMTPRAVKIRRRGGVTKAGDLLDECIARDLHAYLDSLLDDNLYLTPIVVGAAGEFMEEQTVRRMDLLREQIHRLKVELSQGEEEFRIELSTDMVGAAELLKSNGDETPELYEHIKRLEGTTEGKVFWTPGSKQILEGEYVGSFIDRVTRVEVENFFGGNIPELDTVILSGRTSLWPGFQASLLSTLGDVPHWVNFDGDSDTLKRAVVMGVIEREFRWPDLEFSTPEIIGEFGVIYERSWAGEPEFVAYETSGDSKKLSLVNSSELKIGLMTNNGFNECFSLLPDEHCVDGDEDKILDVLLEFDRSGFLKAKVSNSNGVSRTYTETTNVRTLDYISSPWPLGAAKLEYKTPQEVVAG